MFYDKKLMKNKYICKLWLEAHNMDSREQELAPTLPTMCTAVERLLKTKHVDPSSCLSLRTAAVLVGGAAQLYKRQMHSLTADLGDLDKRIRRRNIRSEICYSDSDTDADSSLKTSDSGSRSKMESGRKVSDVQRAYDTDKSSSSSFQEPEQMMRDFQREPQISPILPCKRSSKKFSLRKCSDDEESPSKKPCDRRISMTPEQSPYRTSTSPDWLKRRSDAVILERESFTKINDSLCFLEDNLDTDSATRPVTPEQNIGTQSPLRHQSPPAPVTTMSLFMSPVLLKPSGITKSPEIDQNESSSFEIPSPPPRKLYLTNDINTKSKKDSPVRQNESDKSSEIQSPKSKSRSQSPDPSSGHASLDSDDDTEDATKTTQSPIKTKPFAYENTSQTKQPDMKNFSLQPKELHKTIDLTNDTESPINNNALSSDQPKAISVDKGLEISEDERITSSSNLEPEPELENTAANSTNTAVSLDYQNLSITSSPGSSNKKHDEENLLSPTFTTNPNDLPSSDFDDEQDLEQRLQGVRRCALSPILELTEVRDSDDEHNRGAGEVPPPVTEVIQTISTRVHVGTQTDALPKPGSTLPYTTTLVFSTCRVVPCKFIVSSVSPEILNFK